MDTEQTDYIQLVTADEIAAKRWWPFGDTPGVDTKTVWCDPFGGSYAGLLWLAIGARIPTHSHSFATHHILAGGGRMRDR